MSKCLTTLQYHTIRTSDSYNSLWVELLKDSTSIEPLPTFYQHVTDPIFKKHLLAHHFPLQDEHDDSDRRHEMQYVEANATRYVAGYVCRSLKKKIPSSGDPSKKELLLALWKLIEDEEASDSEQEEQPEPLPSSSDWTKLADRGGLIHINDQAYMTFAAIEESVSSYLNLKNVKAFTDGEKTNSLRVLKPTRTFNSFGL